MRFIVLISALLWANVHVHAKVKSCSQDEIKDIKQCLYKYMEEVYESMDDNLDMRAFIQFVARLVSSGSDCRKFWTLAVCMKSVDPCFDEHLGANARVLTNAAFAFKYSICSDHSIEDTKQILQCVDSYELQNACSTDIDLIQTIEGCQKSGDKYFGCMKSLAHNNSCQLTKRQHITACQLYGFRKVHPCIEHNCANLYLMTSGANHNQPICHLIGVLTLVIVFICRIERPSFDN